MSFFGHRSEGQLQRDQDNLNAAQERFENAFRSGESCSREAKDLERQIHRYTDHHGHAPKCDLINNRWQ